MRRLLHHLLRAGVLLAATGGVVALLLLVLAGSATLDRGLAALFVTGAIGGVVSSIRYLTVRLPIAADAESLSTGRDVWGQLRGMTGDLGFSALLGLGGWILVCVIQATPLGAGRFAISDALAFFVLGAVWMAGCLVTVIAIFFIWMPVAVLVGALGARRRGEEASRSWVVIAWVLTGLDVLIGLMIATAVLVPGGSGHTTSGADRVPLEAWQFALGLGTNVLVCLVCFGLVGVLSWRLIPKRWRERTRTPKP